MALVYRIDRNAKLVVAAGYGTLTDADLFRYERETGARSDMIGYDELIDVSSVTDIDVASEERMENLAAEAAARDAFHGPAKLAIVAPGEFAFGLGRIFQIHRRVEPGSTKNVGVFRTMDAALEFLGIDHPLDLPGLE
ncbi:MAG TPA: hypothetical protein VFV19_13800 [Candidatus Polarisedimenticolaceae bacterium]|nr:hypothetical protein [Candidatus Polarisedimenticolaceae bacterium]